jgi:formiminotetrahydrofolate cyclodeaminase
MLARLSYEAIKLCPPLLEKGNLNLVSDVGVAAVFLESAFTSACFNVQINLKGIGDKKLTRSIQNELKKKEKLVKRIRLQTEVKVGEIIRG